MLKSVFLTAIRHLTRHGVYSIANVVGLTIGITGCLLVYVYVQFELSRGTEYSNGDRIYRVVSWALNSEGERTYNRGADGRIGPAMKASVPEVEAVVRSHAHYPVRVRLGDSAFDDLQIVVTEPSAIDMFDVELTSGSPETALANPSSVMISERVAKMIFGERNPLGATLSVDHRLSGGEYTVTGVYRDPPRTVYALNFAMIATHRTHHPVVTAAWEDVLMHTSWRPVQTFVLLREGARPEHLSDQLDALNLQVNGDEWEGRSGYALQPLSRIHLYGAQDFPGIQAYGNIKTVYSLAAIAAVVLLVACLNFISLATSRLALRSKEVSIRKLVGARRPRLILQFLAESTMLAMAASMLSVVAVSLTLPVFSSFVSRSLRLEVHLGTWGMIALLTIVVGCLAGLYPALTLTRVRPIQTLASDAAPGRVSIRKLLVTFQFAISLVLITSTLLLQEQISFLQSKSIGFQTERLLYIPVVSRNPELHGRQETLKKAFENVPNVVGTAFTMLIPGVNGTTEKVIPEGTAEPMTMQMVYADEDFLDLLGIELLTGRNFSPAIPSDATQAFLINEAAAQRLDWDLYAVDSQNSPLGKRMVWPSLDRHGTVVGVVRDFHIGTLKKPVEPAVIAIRRDKHFSVLIRIGPGDIPKTIRQLRDTWQSFVPNGTFQYEFIDDAISRLYEDERRLGIVSSVFFGLAILIACLGLFALASLTAQLRTKEMGIRKVVGAGTGRLFLQLSRGLLFPVVLACLIGWPIAYVLMDRWLADFASRISITPIPFLVGGLSVLVAAFATVGHRTLQVASTNPVDVLRDE